MAHDSFAPIVTARLRLRPPQASDAEAVFSRYSADPEVTRYVGWPRHIELKNTRDFLAFSQQEWSRWPVGPLLVEDKATGKLLGSTGLAFESPTRASTGYVLARDSWGKGFASEALAAVITLAGIHHVDHLYALCHAEHLPSRRVLERCSFALEKIWSKHTVFPNLGIDEPQDVCRYLKSVRAN